MDLSGHDLQRLAEADRRAVDPPVEVQMATWAKAGQLDWRVKERGKWMGRVRGAEASSGGSELLIFDRRAARGRHSPA